MSERARARRPSARSWRSSRSCPSCAAPCSGASLYFRDLSLHFFPLRRFALEGLRRESSRSGTPTCTRACRCRCPRSATRSTCSGLAAPRRGAALAAARPARAARRARASSLLARAASGSGRVGRLRRRARLRARRLLPLDRQPLRLPPGRRLGAARGARPRARPGGGGRGRAAAATALAVAVALSTTGVEIVAQAMLAGCAGSGCRPPARRAAGWCASRPPWRSARPGRARARARRGPGGGQRPRPGVLPTDVVLAHSVHPFTLVQTVVGGLYGNPANLANEWWGQNFFPRGFPYVLSLYLGRRGAGAGGGRAPLAARPAPTLVVLLLARARGVRSVAGRDSPRWSTRCRRCASSASR